MIESEKLIITRNKLRELGFRVNHHGYKMLCKAIMKYAEDNTQSVTKELYPAIRKEYGYSHSNAVERSIRYAIYKAWNDGDPEAWNRYFHGFSKAPSNLVFIATLSEFLQ